MPHLLNYLYNLKPGECIEYFSSTSLDIDQSEYDVIGPAHPEYDELKWKFSGGRMPTYEEQLDRAISSHSIIIRKR